MSSITKKLLYGVLLFFIGFTYSFAQGGCSAPGPTNLEMTTTTSTSIEITWVPAPGITDYLVEVIEVSSGTTVSTQVVSQNNLTITGLDPGTSYDINVTSICNNGIYGDLNTIRLSTNIVIVDIVMDLGNCDPSSGNQGHVYNGQVLTYPFQTQILSFEGYLNGANAGTPFEFAFQINSSSNFAPLSMKVGPTAQYSQQIRVQPQGSPTKQGLIQQWSTSANAWFDVAEFSPVYSTTRIPELEITWNEDADVTPYYCNNITFGSGNWVIDEDIVDDHNDGHDDTQGLRIAPNPAVDQLLIQVNEETLANVYDLHGRLRATVQLEAGNDLQLDISAWPSGMYIIQYIQQNRPETRSFIKN